MERGIELLACVQFFVIGLSHLIRPREWVAFFVVLRNQGTAGVFANGFLSLWFGGLVIGLHNVWTGWPVILTLIGWAQIIKAMTSFVAPAVAMRGLQRVSVERAWEFQAGGVVFLLLGALMAYLALALPTAR